MIRSSLTLSILVLVSALYTNPSNGEQINSCGPGDIPFFSTDETTRRCRDAFCALPSQDRSGYEENFSKFASHVLSNKPAFNDFLQKCYAKIDGNENGERGLAPDTKAFVLGVYGALFKRTPGGLILKCSAFQIADSTIVTARHCVYDDPSYRPLIDQLVFRRLSAPLTDVQVIGELPNQTLSSRTEIANDFDDYWYLQIQNTIFNYNSSFFRNDYPRTARLLTSGVNLVAFILDANADVSQWASAFRFSIVTGAQWLPWQILPQAPPSERAKAQCIYHKSSSFSGLSGAPIIGEEHMANGSRILFIFGLHLRTGQPDPIHRADADCGTYPGFNIGLALPDDILRRVKPKSKE